MLILNIIIMCLAQAEIIDYTRNDYLLLQDEDCLSYSNYGDLFHVTNLTYYNSIFEEELAFFKQKNNTPDWEITLELNLAKTILQQLGTSRQKRGINEIGTVWKWIAGTPDHDDLLTVQNKINDLIDNNNKQFVINSKIFKQITKVTGLIQNLILNEEKTIRKYRTKLLVLDLQNLIDTITLSKVKILNPKILSEEDNNDILKHENVKLTLTDLMDVSKFSIITNNELIVIYIKYPVINSICKFYNTRAIAQSDGKLLINEKIINCNSTYFQVQDFKKEITNKYCKTNFQKNCIVNILNNKKANCTKIREKNKQIDVITEGAILVSGQNKINNNMLNGTFLIIFNDTILINNISYVNTKAKILDYIKHYNFEKYNIDKYIESNNEKLKFENINIIQKFIKKTGTTFYVCSIIILIIICYVIHKIRNALSGA